MFWPLYAEERMKLMKLTAKDTLYKAGVTSLMACSLLSLTPGAFADSKLDDLLSKPIVKQAAVGAAVGAGVGVLSDKTSVGKGAVAGALTGAGTGALSQSKYMQDKPLLRRTAKGAVIGTGASYALGSDKLKGAVIGAGAGAGYHYLEKYLHDH
jgi:hypothetical protein